MKRILALDPAGLCGWAMDDAAFGEEPLAGTWDVSTKTCGTLGHSLLELHKCLRRLFLELPYDCMVYEAPMPLAAFSKRRPTNADAVRSLHARGGLIEMVAAEIGVEVYEVPVQAARRYFTGNARADKGQVWDLCKTLGWLGMGYTLDTTDAIAILAYARGVYRSEQVLFGRRVS